MKLSAEQNIIKYEENIWDRKKNDEILKKQKFILK